MIGTFPAYSLMINFDLGHVQLHLDRVFNSIKNTET